MDRGYLGTGSTAVPRYEHWRLNYQWAHYHPGLRTGITVGLGGCTARDPLNPRRPSRSFLGKFAGSKDIHCQQQHKACTEGAQTLIAIPSARPARLLCSALFRVDSDSKAHAMQGASNPCSFNSRPKLISQALIRIPKAQTSKGQGRKSQSKWNGAIRRHAIIA